MIVVLVVAAGAAWESAALRELGDYPGIVVLKRCVDVDDLLATAAAGQADVAVVGLDAPGLDTVAVDHLLHHDVRPVAVVPAGPQEASRLRAGRLGVRVLVGEGDVEDLPEAVLRAAHDPGAAAASGAADPAPASEDSLLAAPAPVPERDGRVVAVWGPAGAPGRSTVAAGVAAELARRGRRVLLVDADTYAASQAQQLGVLDEVSGLLSAARLATTGHLEDEVASVQRALDARLAVITGLPRPDRWREVRAGVVETLLRAARRHGDVVVDTAAPLEGDLDLTGRGGRNQVTLEVLGAADEVLVVGTADPVGLARLARALVELRESVGPVGVRVLINRMRTGLGWSEGEVAAMVRDFGRLTSLHFLPHDLATVDRALAAGRTLVEDGDSPLLRALAEVVDVVDPSTAPRAANTGRPARRHAHRGRRSR